MNNPLDNPPNRALDNPFDHGGKVVLVTGGTRGIGRAIAARYQEAGADVVVCGRTAPDVGDPTPDFMPCDVRDAGQVDALVDALVERFGRLDVVVNNAGGAPQVDAASASPRFSEAVVRLNLLAPLWVAQSAYRVMRDQAEGGSIVNISSVSAARPAPGAAAYAAAKAGLLNLTQTLAVEWAPEVRVNAVVAGLIATEAADQHYGDAASVARVAATVPLGRMGTPGDIADACLFLSSPAAGFVTGAALPVHGGNERPAFLAALQPDRFA